MNKYQLKKLIKEVIHEVEAIASEPQVAAKGKEEKEMTGSELALQKAKELGKEKTVIQLVLRGLRPGKRFKQMLSDMAWEAKKQDLEVIHAEIRRAGTSAPVVTMDSPEIQKRFRTKEDEPEDMSQLSPEERLARIKQGEREPEWKEMEKREREENLKKKKLKQAKIAAGTYDPDDISLWTDEDWRKWERTHPATKGPKLSLGQLR
jgi:hypothetical protein